MAQRASEQAEEEQIEALQDARKLAAENARLRARLAVLEGRHENALAALRQALALLSEEDRAALV